MHKDMKECVLTMYAKLKMSILSAITCPSVNAFISRIIYGRQYEISILSNNVMAPAMMDRGVSASRIPNRIAPHANNGSLRRYMVRIRNSNRAAVGKEIVVGRGFFLTVTTTRNAIGAKQRRTETTSPPGASSSLRKAHWHSKQASKDTQVSAQLTSASSRHR